MEKIEKTIRYNSLLLIYQNLLTDTQKDILSVYFKFDLSLSEIASERDISRAAVEDAIRKGINKLEEYESALHLYEKQIKSEELISKIKEENSSKEIDELERIIKNGV